MTSGVRSQKPHSSKPSKPISLACTTSLTVFVLFATPVAGWVSRLGYIFRAPSPSHPPFFCLFDQCCWLLYGCWLPSRALLSSLLLSCCTQCYCEALRAQTRWGALEVLFIIIIIIMCMYIINSRDPSWERAGCKTAPSLIHYPPWKTVHSFRHPLVCCLLVFVGGRDKVCQEALQNWNLGGLLPTQAANNYIYFLQNNTLSPNSNGHTWCTYWIMH